MHLAHLIGQSVVKQWNLISVRACAVFPLSAFKAGCVVSVSMTGRSIISSSFATRRSPCRPQFQDASVTPRLTCHRAASGRVVIYGPIGDATSFNYPWTQIARRPRDACLSELWLFRRLAFATGRNQEAVFDRGSRSNQPRFGLDLWPSVSVPEPW